MKKLTATITSALFAGGIMLGGAAPAQAAWSGIDSNNCRTTATTIQSRSPAPGFYVKPGQRYHVQYTKRCLSTPTWFNQKFRGQKPRMVIVATWKYDPQSNRTYHWTS